MKGMDLRCVSDGLQHGRKPKRFVCLERRGISTGVAVCQLYGCNGSHRPCTKYSVFFLPFLYHHRTEGFPIKMSCFDYEVVRPPPELGEHNTEIIEDWLDNDCVGEKKTP